MAKKAKKRRVGVACQGGGSHTAFSAGVLQGLLSDFPDDAEIVVISGTSGGAMCAAVAWDGLVREDLPRAVRRLGEFWHEVAAREPWDKVLNHSLQMLMMLRNHMILPEVSPYDLPPWGEDRFRAMLASQFDFAELRRLAQRPGAPALQIGAVEVMSGRFEVFTGAELCVETLLASAAIPELFRAVHVPGRGHYWDGLFSQNPPVHDLTDFHLHEIWVIQINPTRCENIPTETHEIVDRRNELAGNLSLEQELKQVEQINRLVAHGCLDGTKYHHIDVMRIAMEMDLHYATKLDRSPAFLADLMERGRLAGRTFLNERADRYANGYPGPQETVSVANA